MSRTAQRPRRTSRLAALFAASIVVLIGLAACRGDELPRLALGDPSVQGGGMFRLYGTGWPPAQYIFIYFRDPNRPAELQPIFSQRTDSLGRFDVDVPYPSEPRWTTLPAVDVIARDQNQVYQAIVQLANAATATPPPITATPLPPTAAPTETATPTRPTGTPKPALSPTPTGAPVQPPPNTWRGEYYEGVDLRQAAQALIRFDEKIDFDWGDGSPAPNVPADNFSVRWTRRQDFEGGTYAFTLQVDDGVRLFVDNVLMIEEWHTASSATYTRNITLSPGAHDLRVEMFEQAGRALAKLSYDRIEVHQGWAAEFFNNRNLEGAPVFRRDYWALHFEWGNGSPDRGVEADNFSARWRRTFDFPAGPTTFVVQADDQVRLWIDGQLEIDRWDATSPGKYTQTVNLAAGLHEVVVEYRENTGLASIAFYYEPPKADGQWRGEYFANRDLADLPVLVRYDGAIKFDWRAGSPAPEVPGNNFSVRWSRDVPIDRAGRYRLSVTVDDGVKVYVNGQLARDEWEEHNAATFSFLIDLRAGSYPVRVEYFEASGVALIQMGEPEFVEDLPTPMPPTGTPTPPPTPTPSPTR
jgi:hypothetical protein